MKEQKEIVRFFTAVTLTDISVSEGQRERGLTDGHRQTDRVRQKETARKRQTDRMDLKIMN